MAHFAAYWKFYDRLNEPLVVDGWRIRGKSRLANAVKGDILWLFTSGVKCRRTVGKKVPEDPSYDHVEYNEAYLAEVFTVQRVVPEIAGPFTLVVKGTKGKCIGLYPPIWVDDIVRPEGRGTDIPIGSVRQGAWRLPEEVADQFQARLRRESPEAYSDVFG